MEEEMETSLIMEILEEAHLEAKTGSGPRQDVGH